MIQKAYPLQPQLGTRVGADVGATLAKLFVRRADGRTSLRLLPTRAMVQVAREVESAEPERVGLTGGGAPELAALLHFDTAPAPEFEAWRVGASAMLRQAGAGEVERYLLVSLGTGTSAMLVDRDSVTRAGGTALGGGTVVGLGAALIGSANFDELVSLAREGDRRNVDLLVSDIYRSGESPLPGDLNASSFAKLALIERDRRPEPRDLAHAIMGLVGENVALICNGIAAAAQVTRIAFGGTTLRANTTLVEILRLLSAAHGNQAIFLPDGEFAGALGALELAG